MRAQIEQRIAADPRLRRAELVGAVPHEQAVAHIRGARALIVPSQWFEGVPLSLLEAFACAVPVIAGRIGSLAEVISEQDNGLLFAPGDATDLSRAIGVLLSSGDMASVMGARGRELYLSQHTLNHNAQVLAALYQELT